MTIDKLKSGDRVRIGNSVRTFIVEEVDPPGALACAPSSYVVRIRQEDGKGPDLIYGNHRLILVT